MASARGRGARRSDNVWTATPLLRSRSGCRGSAVGYSVRTSHSRRPGCAPAISSTSWPSLPPGSRLAMTNRTRGRACSAIDPRPVPDLEHRQIPQAVRVIGAAGHVVGHVALHFRLMEVAAVAGAGVVQDALEPRPQLAAEPFADRDAEAHLPAVHELVRQPAARRELLEDPLALRAAQLQPAGQRRG